MEDVELHLAEAEESLDEGDPEGALEAADRATALAPELVDGWYLRALALLDLERVEEAREAVERALETDPTFGPAGFTLADLALYEDSDPARALAMCEAYLREELEDELYADFLNLKASALCELGEFAAALPVYERAGQLCDEREDPGGIGWCHYELGDFARAKAALEAAVRGLGRENPATHHYLAVTLERSGKRRAAARHFRIAARLDPENWFVPPSLSEDEFAALVEAAVEGLSSELKGRLDNVAVAIEPWPSDEDIEGTQLSPAIVGMFRGPSLDERSTGDQWSHLPGQIVVYQRNLEYTCRSRDEMVEQIRVTLWHEIGHFLGLDEEDLDARGLG